MKEFTTKQEKKLYTALQKLIGSCITKTGNIKKPSGKQFDKASEALHNYEDFVRRYHSDTGYKK